MIQSPARGATYGGAAERSAHSAGPTWMLKGLKGHMVCKNILSGFADSTISCSTNSKKNTFQRTPVTNKEIKLYSMRLAELCVCNQPAKCWQTSSKREQSNRSQQTQAEPHDPSKQRQSNMTPENASKATCCLPAFSRGRLRLPD